MEAYLTTKDMDKAVLLLKQSKESDYLSERNLNIIYAYHPDLKKAMAANSLKRVR